MATIHGSLNSFDQDREFAGTIGQDVLYEAILADLQRYNVLAQVATGLFVGRDTTDHKLRIKMPGYAQMQKIGQHAPPHNVKVQGYYDVGFPLVGHGLGYGWNDVDFKYLSVGDVKRTINTVKQAYLDMVRRRVMARVFDNTQSTFSDNRYGNISVEPLANDDGTEFPPTVGTTSLATDDHYSISGYTTANISDANDPSITLRDELVEHSGGRSSGGDDIVFLADETVAGNMEDLTDFVPVSDYAVKPGDETAQLVTRGRFTLPGRLAGRINSCWVVAWNWMPSDYIIAINSSMPKPLFRRVDETGTGLQPGLQLVAENENAPLASAWFRARQGYGTANRLSAAVMELAGSGSYSIPTGFSVSY